MVAADSLVATPTAAAVCQPISPTPSQFLSVSASPSAAAQHNTILKLNCLLEKPELAERVRAELCPNGLTLGDLFTMSAWSAADRKWKGLFGGAAKAATLYSWVRLLAPACNLPDPSEVTKFETQDCVRRIQRSRASTTRTSRSSRLIA